jgi:hypothetical protein
MRSNSWRADASASIDSALVSGSGDHRPAAVGSERSA